MFWYWIYPYMFCPLLPSLLEENRTFNKSSPFITFFGHFGCLGMKPKVLSFPFKVLLQVSLGQPLLCPWNGYFCVTGVIHSQYMSQPFPPSSLDDNAYLFHFSSSYIHVYVLYGSIIARSATYSGGTVSPQKVECSNPQSLIDLSHENNL